jgi:GNAT superfamily N-acetyltransferase
MDRLRLATPGDVPALRELIALSVRSLSTGRYSSAQADAALASEVIGVDTQLVSDGTYFVIECDNALVAAGGWSARLAVWGGDQAKTETGATIDPATTPARIRAFFVHPQWTRRGFARRLYEACEHAARSHGFRAFELVATLPGEPLFRALGFTPIEPISIPMPGNLTLPCLRMRRPFDS